MRGLAICYVNVYFGLEAVGNQQPDLVLPLVAKIGFATGIVKMPEISSANRQSSARQRSAVTNNRRLFVAGDDRSAWSRRYRDLIVAHTSDLGGAAALSEAQRSLVRRAAGLECELEQMEGRMSQGMEVNLDSFGRDARNRNRIVRVLG